MKFHHIIISLAIAVSALSATNHAQPAQASEQIPVVDPVVALADIGTEASHEFQVEYCPTENFMDVASYQSKQGYPAPVLNVNCTSDTVVIQSNGIPNFEFVRITPNDLQEQNFQWEIPLYPEYNETTTEIPLLGPVAIAVNGLPIYGPNEAQPTFGDPYVDMILDYCNGHTDQRGAYHFHARPDCLFTDAEGNTSLVLAYALDGFPILAPYICEDTACTSVREVQSSWQKTSNVAAAWDANSYVAGSGDLDECNGMLGADGSYRYYATDTFPYFLGCYHGNAANNGFGGGGGQGQPTNGGQGQPPQSGGNPPQGAPPQGGRPPRRG